MKIAIIGTRGIPAKYGGFETFAEVISIRLIQAGYSVVVQCDHSVIQDHEWYGIGLYYSHVTKSAHPLRYYFDGLYWGMRNADILLVAGTGGSIFYFLNFFYKKIIITNTDGLESGRLKWSLLKRWYIKLSEIIAVRSSDQLIADSEAVSVYLEKKYPAARHKITVAEYGATLNDNCDPEVLKRRSVIPGEYYLVISRIEPENNIGVIIEGFLESRTECPLLVVGPLVKTKYCSNLVNKLRNSRVQFLGGIYDRNELNSLRFGCKAYIHGHSVGGTNPSLLEAMGNRNLVICHDNVFNREVTLGSQFYFTGPQELARVVNIVEALPKEARDAFRNLSSERIRTYYCWDNILIKYSGIFNKFQSGKADQI
jgi:glycosyltransferase involved in cell wall biosynthesis